MPPNLSATLPRPSRIAGSDSSSFQNVRSRQNAGSAHTAGRFVPFIVHSIAEHPHAPGAILLVKLGKPGYLDAARRAPSGPEVHEHRLSLVLIDRGVCALRRRDLQARLGGRTTCFLPCCCIPFPQPIRVSTATTPAIAESFWNLPNILPRLPTSRSRSEKSVFLKAMATG